MATWLWSCVRASSYDMAHKRRKHMPAHRKHKSVQISAKLLVWPTFSASNVHAATLFLYLLCQRDIFVSKYFSFDIVKAFNTATMLLSIRESIRYPVGKTRWNICIVGVHVQRHVLLRERRDCWRQCLIKKHVKNATVKLAIYLHICLQPVK